MSASERPVKRLKDPSLVPGAIVIRPKENTAMVYNPETTKVTDTETGYTFGIKRLDYYGNYAAGIHADDGTGSRGYELRYNDIKSEDGLPIRVVWEVKWARRPGWRARLKPGATKENPTAKRANVEGQFDDIQLLSQFLRARRDGVARADGREPKGETVIVDRRSDYLEPPKGERQ